MEKPLLDGVKHYFSGLQDPRRNDWNQRHDFHEILTIALCSIICGADDWVSVARFGEAKQEWFQTFLDLPNGIPSHDTFNNLFAKLDPDAFQDGFTAWASSLARELPDDIVAVDGKTLRRSFDRARSKSALHMVSAWSTANELVLGQLKTDAKSNEIHAIPQLLERLALEGSLVTIDAMGCQRKIAKHIVEKDADYLLGVKENQLGLHEAIHALYIEAESKGFTDAFPDSVVVEGDAHGRVERRRCRVSQNLAGLGTLPEKWEGLKTLVVIESERVEADRTTRERRLYISSRAGDADYFLTATRHHWHIENKLHWVQDVAYREDESRHRLGNSTENLAILRRISLNLLKNEKTDKVGIKNKRLRAGWDSGYLLKVLSGLAL
jgi:predicted transposase YbfD/YdcC